jgi:hypothetical protein
MNWLMNLWGNISDWLGTSDGHTFIIALGTSIATIILSLAIPAFGRSLWRFLKFLWRSPLMFRKWYREWNYWKRFGIIYKVISKGNLQIIEETPKSYRLMLSIDLSFENRDAFDIAFMDIKERIDIESLAVNGQKKTYYLISQNLYFQMNQGVKSESLLFQTVANQKPMLGETVYCKVRDIQKTSLSVKGISRPVKIKTFKVNVEWVTLRPPPTSDMGGSQS